MVNKKHRLYRLGFTLIELIFAIVIIAVAVLSLPMMTQVTAKGVEDNIIQEAIFAASSELMSASAGYWDDSSIQDNAFDEFSRVIDISGDCNNNILSDRFRLRPGHVHRRCLDSNSTAPVGAVNLDLPNLNNATCTNENLFSNTITDDKGYKNVYKKTVTITRVDDIKFVDITIKNKNDNTLVVLKMQIANVGEVDYASRSF